MSARNLPVGLSPRARRDFENILLYTLREWGEEQEEIYADAIRQALMRISDNPQIGRLRNDLRPNTRSLPVERHIIYEVRRDEVRIVRIIHGRMNAGRALR